MFFLLCIKTCARARACVCFVPPPARSSVRRWWTAWGSPSTSPYPWSSCTPTSRRSSRRSARPSSSSRLETPRDARPGDLTTSVVCVLRHGQTEDIRLTVWLQCQRFSTSGTIKKNWPRRCWARIQIYAVFTLSLKQEVGTRNCAVSTSGRRVRATESERTPWTPLCAWHVFLLLAAS